jgi:glycosyltransferase involved in cell wall biosynthesis
MFKPILYLIIPCFNEEEVLPISAKKLNKKISQLIKSKKISSESKILFIDDGSKDSTWKIISDLQKDNNLFAGLLLSRNFGHQKALLSGLETAQQHCDFTISLDADLQDDVKVIDKFIESYENDDQICYGVREDRENDSFLKKATAEGFYNFMNKLGVELIFNHADCRMMTARAIRALSEYKEVNLFLRGLVPMVGFQSSMVTYKRQVRQAGKSKYPLKKMLSFAFDGLTSFSVKPIRFIFFLGILIFCVSILMSFYSLIRYFGGQTVSGWTFLSISIWLLAGVQMLSLGILGEYLGKIYAETKHRPRYLVAEKIGLKE